MLFTVNNKSLDIVYLSSLPAIVSFMENLFYMYLV